MYKHKHTYLHLSEIYGYVLVISHAHDRMKRWLLLDGFDLYGEN